jgi:hypothetical protein
MFICSKRSKDINGSPNSKIKCTVYAGFRTKNINFLKSGENRSPAAGTTIQRASLVKHKFTRLFFYIGVTKPKNYLPTLFV